MELFVIIIFLQLCPTFLEDLGKLAGQVFPECITDVDWFNFINVVRQRELVDDSLKKNVVLITYRYETCIVSFPARYFFCFWLFKRFYLRLIKCRFTFYLVG